MSIRVEERLSDSPYVEKIMHGWTVRDGSSIRPAECHWHMVFRKQNGTLHPLVVGALPTAGVAAWGEGAELLWIKFRLGTFIPHLPAKQFINVERSLPDASSQSFWLHGSAWQYPTYENVDTFVARLARANVLCFDPVVNAALQDQTQTLSARTIRHRFLQTTGLSQSYIRQMARAQQAAERLQQGGAILDAVYDLGYFDQPHLTRALKQFVGHSPAQLIRLSQAM